MANNTEYYHPFYKFPFKIAFPKQVAEIIIIQLDIYVLNILNWCDKLALLEIILKPKANSRYPSLFNR